MSPEDAPRPDATALRTSQAEWVQGTSDRPSPAGWAQPLTSHSYEGLLVLLDGENWKVLDSVGLRVQGSQPLARPVLDATPLQVTRRYALDPGELSVTARLLPHAGASGTVLELAFQADRPCRLEVRPVFDLRHMYQDSDPERIRAIAAPDGLALMGGRAAVRVGMPGARLQRARHAEPLEHPMGSGFREQVGDRIVFRAETTTGLVLGTWHADLLPGQPLTLRLAAAPDPAEADRLYGEAATSREHARRESRFAEIRRWVGPEPGLAERIFVMSEGFGMRVAGTLLPEAGGWWFRTPWFRDVFEGLLGNWRTLAALGLSHRVTDALEAAFRLQDPLSGRVPNRLPECKEDQEVADRNGRLPDSYYHSADATLLAFTLLDELEPPDPGLRAAADRAFERAIAAFRRAHPETVDGPPVLTDEGLLMCVPWHTWTDGKRTVGPVADLPLRVPKAWQQAALDQGRSPAEVFAENHQAAYYLPEINAQWLRALRWASRHRLEAGDREEAARILERAIPAFRERFWDPAEARVANLVTRAGRYDWTPGSPGLVSLALVLPMAVFTPDERLAAWLSARDRLAVTHGGELFGLLVKDSDERHYLGDEQYHEAVCWPRDSHWLWRLLADLGQAEACAEITRSALGHQQREGVLFYNHELFSLPDGSEDARWRQTGRRLVPVKNPMQWWSQWCDPFLQRVDPAVGSGKVKTMAKQLAYFKGAVVPIEDANVNIMCHAFNYGTGCFEGIRAYWNEEHEELYALFLAEHYQRMFRSAKILFMEPPHTLDEIVAITLDLIRQCGYRQDVYIRPTLYKEDGVVGVRLHNLKDGFHIYVTPMGNYIDTDRGLKCGTSSWRRIDDTMIPARAKVVGAYINSALAKTEAFHRGFDEAVFLNVDGHVCEGSAENLFIMRDGELITPGQSDNILEGITRKAIMELAEKELGLRTTCRPIDRTELMIADEMMLCGTAGQIAWVESIDHRTIGNGAIGPVTRKLQELYGDAVRGKLARYSHWVSPVYGGQGKTQTTNQATATLS